ncbi:MAG: PAS domain S-box protein [Syntrophorhabdaceae bacterium]|nr:PAS domain S-box protein [Syntrophorhabdaceae bacterium]
MAIREEGYLELSKEVERLKKRVEELERSEEELKKVEAELREAEEKYRHIYENATEGIFQITPEGRFLSANPSLAKIHGYDSPEELITSITDIGRQLYVDPKRRLELLAKLERDGFAQDFEVEMYRKDRSLHWISINIKAVKDKNGKILYTEGTMQDITKRKMAEKALIESEERYRTAIEHSNDGITIVQGNKHQYVNRRFVEMFEYESPEEIIGRPITFVVHPDDHELVININRRRQRGEEVPSRYEFKGITKKGRVIYVEVSGTSTQYREAPVYLIYLRDITERKMAEEALRTERNRLRTLTDFAPFGIAMIDKTGKYRYVNPKFKEIFGYDINDIPNGRVWFKKLFPDPAYRKKVISSWVEDIKNRRQGERVPRTFDVVCKDGTKKTINFIPVRLYTGEFLVSFEDITERIAAHEALIKSHKELENLNRAKTKAVNHISHELKTPLAVIQGHIRILKRKLKDLSLEGTFKSTIDSLERNLERLFAISKETDEIFRVSMEIESSVVCDDLDRLLRRIGAISEMPQPVKEHWNALKGWLDQFNIGYEESYQSIDLYPFIRSIVEKIKEMAKHRNIEFKVKGEEFIFVSIDPHLLKDIAVSILKNSVENTPDGGKIEVVVEQKEDRAWIHFTDFGIGITEENQKYIFDGMFHTKETEMYASKKPFDFGAGGKGLELLRIRMYAKRTGLEIKMVSKRCEFIPKDTDICPGDISKCPYCKTREDCFNSGWTTFSVSLPMNLRENLDQIGNACTETP